MKLNKINIINHYLVHLRVLSALVVMLFIFSNSYAQDIHLSQFNSSPQNLNPAQTGLFDGDWRFVGNYRSQWAAVPVPYKTFSFSTDTRLKTKLTSGTPALGLLVNNDNSGTSHLSTTQIYLSASFIKKLNKDSTHFVSLAIQPGVATKSFNASALTFDNQYDGDSYNAALPSGENFTNTRITYFDAGAGLAYLYHKNQRMKVNIGVSALHLTQPHQKFFGNSTDKLSMKTAVSGLAEFPASENVDIIPTLLYQHQGTYNETVAGGFAKYFLTPVNGMTTAVSLGGFYRMKDAFIIAAGMDYMNFTVGVSYDMNTSKLIAATNHRGGFEISVIYIFKKIVPFVAKKRVCPIYM